MAYRVVQWTTGNVGRQSVAGDRGPPRPRAGRVLRLVADKAGRDVGELCGHRPRSACSPPTTSTRCSRLKPDCVVYNPMWVDVDEMVRILEAGVNIVSTAAFITGHSLGDGRRRIVDACERGRHLGVRLGHQPRLRRPASPSSRPACATASTRSPITEAADTTGYDSPATELPVGFGRPIDDPEPAGR